MPCVCIHMCTVRESPTSRSGAATTTAQRRAVLHYIKRIRYFPDSMAAALISQFIRKVTHRRWQVAVVNHAFTPIIALRHLYVGVQDFASLEEYKPVKPLDVLAQEIGVPVASLVKLDANENLYGPVPEVRPSCVVLRCFHVNFLATSLTCLRSDAGAWSSADRGCHPQL
jgi:hypothetical protein